MSYRIEQNKLLSQLKTTRAHSLDICKPLKTEDHVLQPMANVSPPKWHLAHTTWFFEQLVLLPYLKDYKEYHPDFSFLFNSYYNTLGERTLRADRGFMSRPTVEEVHSYRQYADEKLTQLFNQELPQDVLSIIEIGINHEQQHQELLVYDLKYILGFQPTFPAYGDRFIAPNESTESEWVTVEPGLYDIGTTGDSFSYDNEGPRHKNYLHGAKLRSTLIKNGEFLEFIKDGGYKNHDLWLSEGWDFINEQSISSPLYWHQVDGAWKTYTLRGLENVNPDAPVQHISLYEAAAFADWAGYRLPTEFEWEIAANQFKWGSLWEWTQSAYLPYPGYKKAPGALGEYNAKFMLNQNVLRGSSVATPKGHARKTYRNFFHASCRWIFSGFRLASDLK